MEIGLYIAELLGEQDKVSVAGLGTFFKQRIAGSFDKHSSLFYPPSYHLSFKEDVFSFSGLSEYISLKRSLSISSSEELINKFTDSIHDILKSADAVEINHLGSLYKKNENLAFKPSDSFGIADKFYGLKPIFELKSAIVSPLIIEEIKAEIPEYKVEEEAIDSEEEIYYQAPKARILPILMISILAITASLIALFYFDKSFNQFIKDIISSNLKPATVIEPIKNLSTTAVVTLNSNKVAPLDSSGIKKVAIQEESKPEVTVKPVTASVEEKIPTLKQDISYEIIVAAFSRKIDAETYVREMSSKGFKAKIVENMPGKMMKISLGTFTEEDLANIELKRIQKEINKDAWIARVKPLKNQ